MIKVNGYTGSTERMEFVVNEVLKVLPQLKGQELTCDGGRAWGKDIYINDSLFTVKIHTPLKSWEFDQCNGLREYFFEGYKNMFDKQLKDAQEALQGVNNQFTIEQAKSFLRYNNK